MRLGKAFCGVKRFNAIFDLIFKGFTYILEVDISELLSKRVIVLKLERLAVAGANFTSFHCILLF